MGYQWVATSMLTGELICDLKGLICPNPQQTIGQYESCTATLPIPTAPPGWQLATTKGASVIWLLVDTPDGGTVPVWGGYVSASTLDHSDNVQMTLATLETYLDCRYTGTRTYTNEDGNLICQDLIQNCVAVGPQGGLPIRVNIVGPAGQPQTISWLDQNDVTVYAALQSLTALMGGPEWFISGEWQHNPERITPVFNVGGRLGTPQTPGLTPPVVFDMPGNLAGFSTLGSFAQGLGANSVMAYSSGQGTVRPQSPVQNQPDPLRPTFEYRWSPSQNTLSIPQLTQWAQAALGILAAGSISLTAAVKLAPGVVYGVDWQLGDDIGYQIGVPTPGSTLTRTNLASDPAATANGVVANQIGWGADWFGTGTTGTNASVVEVNDGPIPQLTSYQRKTWASANVGEGNVGWSHAPLDSTQGYPVVAGQTVTISSYLRPSSGGHNARIQFSWCDSTGTVIGSNAYGTTIVMTAGAWSRIATTVTAPSGTAYLGFRSDVIYGPWAPGDTLDGTGLLVEYAGSLGGYFDGAQSPAATPTETVTYAWQGAANGSPSTQTTLTTPTPPVPAFRNGLSGVARVIGFTYTVGNSMSMQVILAGGTLLQFDVQQALNLFVNNTILTVGTV